MILSLVLIPVYCHASKSIDDAQQKRVIFYPISNKCTSGQTKSQLKNFWNILNDKRKYIVVSDKVYKAFIALKEVS